MLGQHLLAALLIVGFPVWDHFETKRLKASNDPRVKVLCYRKTIAVLWLLAAFAVFLVSLRALMTFQGTVPGWLAGSKDGLEVGLLIGGAVALTVPIVLVRTNATIRRRFHDTLAKLSFFLPSTKEERVWFALLSVSAGICEEILFRGFLIRYLASLPVIPNVTVAFLVASVVFGIAHLYQGFWGVVQTGLMAAVFGAVLFLTGSLVAPMILHSLIDLRVIFLYQPPEA